MTSAAQSSLAERYPALDADFARLLEKARASGAAPLHELTVAEARARGALGPTSAIPGPSDVRAVDEIVAGVRVRDYSAPLRRTEVVVLWLHGGGWIVGDLDYFDPFCRVLADRLGADVRSVDYRLAPENRFPAAVEDVLAVARATAAEHPFVIGGDSAGGNLAAVCAQQLVGEAALRGQVLLYPVVDCDLDRESYRRNSGLMIGVDEMAFCFDHYAPDSADRTSALVSPLRAAIPPALAPAVVALAGHDPLHDEGVAYADALRAAGTPVAQLDFPALVHGFLRYTAVVPAAVQAQDVLVQEIGKLLETKPGESHGETR